MAVSLGVAFVGAPGELEGAGFFLPVGGVDESQLAGGREESGEVRGGQKGFVGADGGGGFQAVFLAQAQGHASREQTGGGLEDFRHAGGGGGGAGGGLAEVEHFEEDPRLVGAGEGGAGLEGLANGLRGLCDPAKAQSALAEIEQDLRVGGHAPCALAEESQSPVGVANGQGDAAHFVDYARVFGGLGVGAPGVFHGLGGVVELLEMVLGQLEDRQHGARVGLEGLFVKGG